MSDDVYVRVAASPPLLDDLVRRQLAGDGLLLTDSADCLVTVVTADHVSEAHSRVVLVLGNSRDSEVEMIVDERRSAPAPLQPDKLHDLVLELGRRVPLMPASRPPHTESR